MVAAKLMEYYNITVSFTRLENCGRRSEVMANEIHSGSSGPGSNRGWGYSIPYWIKKTTLTVFHRCVEKG